MIPKVIHYCWFGRKSLPASAVKCIASWRKYLPDYEIKEWNESNFDINLISYTKEAYRAEKYAFVSDYARFWVLYHYGGMYFDTDVEVIKSFDPILARGAFMGCENDGTNLVNRRDISVAAGLGIASPLGLDLYKTLLDLYENLSFFQEDGSYNLETVVEYTTALLFDQYGLQNINKIQQVAGITIYPREYFNPKDFYTGRLTLTPNTYSIHHFSMSWLPAKAIFFSNCKRLLMRIFGCRNIEKVISLFKLKIIKDQLN